MSAHPAAPSWETNTWPAFASSLPAFAADASLSSLAAPPRICFGLPLCSALQPFRKLCSRSWAICCRRKAAEMVRVDAAVDVAADAAVAVAVAADAAGVAAKRNAALYLCRNSLIRGGYDA